MWQLITDAFNLNGLVPHGFCLKWNPLLIWTLVCSDLVITISYFSIPFAILFLAKKRPDLRNSRLFTLFGLFIVVCGITHLLDIVTIWLPNYWLNALAKLLTALLSAATALIIWRSMPLFLYAPSIQQLEQAKSELVHLNARLEQAVQTKTEDLCLLNERLANEKSLLRSLIDNIPDYIFIKNTEGVYLTCNKAVETYFGAPESEIIGKTDFDFVDAPTAESFRQRDNETLISKNACFSEDLITCADGRQLFLETIKIPFLDDHQRIIGLIGIGRNITERKHAESQLQLLGKALEAAVNAIVIFDEKGVIEWVNPAFTVMTGYSPQEAIGLTPQALFQSEQQDQDFFDTQWDIISNGQVWYGEILNRRKDGTYYAEEKTITPVFDEQGNIHHFISIKQDVSLRKRNEAELQGYRDHLEQLIDERTLELLDARNEAQRQTEVKSAFLATMSHEIRSPINAVLGICYLLEQRQLDTESSQLLHKMHKAGDSLLAIINDILDFSKIEAGRIEIEYAVFSLSDILENLAVLMSAAASTKELELIINPPAVEVDKLIGDSLRLQQVLINLLSNAIKFTEYGEVELSIQIQREVNRQVYLLFTIRDTGIGMSPDQQKDIFSAFSQADTTITRRFGGSGLGLCISQQLVKLMGGTLQVKSQIGSGSEFCFELPFQYDTHLERIPSHLSYLELLIADDSATSREAMINTVRSLGWEADAVKSGENALQQVVTRSEAHNPYDVILLDWKMPGKDGLKTAQDIHEILSINHAELKSPPIVIMVTAYSRDELLQQSGNTQINAILSKPITPSALYNTIADIINKRDRIKFIDAAVDIQKKRIPNSRILVVDDSEINREVAQYILESNGAFVSLAKDGQDALNWLTAHPDSIDIILMDIQMPYMDGYTTTRLIRQNPRWASLPIIALTAGAFESFKTAAYEAGMNEFISKPFNIEQLLSTIQNHTGNVQRTTSLPQNKINQLEKSPSIHLALPGIDVQKGLKLWGDEAVYQKFLAKFINSYKDAGNEIAQLLRLNDNFAASALTHKLKGVSGSLALTDVEQIVHQLDELFQTGIPLIETAESLQKAIDEVGVSIAQWKSYRF